jgi:hydroxypyruvate isomerase
MPKFAANLTMMFADRPFPDRFAAARAAGFTGVEFLFPYEHPAEDVARWLRENGLRNVLFNLSPGNWSAGERGIAALPGREAEFRRSVSQAVEYADALGTPCLHAMAGVVAGGVTPRHREVYVENLSFAAAEVARHGRTLVIEAINTRDIPGFFLTRQSEAHRIVQEIGAPNLKVQMDFYHAQIMEGDLTTTFTTSADRIGHLQIASVPDRHEPDEGEVDYRHVFAIVDASGYDGWIGCEYRPRGRTEDGLGWLDTLCPDWKSNA